VIIAITVVRSIIPAIATCAQSPLFIGAAFILLLLNIFAFD
jgi:hypothetical protein